MSDTQHTHLPWHADDLHRVWGLTHMVAECKSVLMADGSRDTATAKANNELIVRACNSHDDLLASLSNLRTAVKRLEAGDSHKGSVMNAAITDADAAITKAGG